jgi:hypothetical protein
MSVDRSRLVEGMMVIGSDGLEVGRVKVVRTVDFLVDLAMRRDVFVPFSAIREIGGASVVLSVRGDEIGDQGWEPASLLGMPSESSDEADTLATDRGDRVVGTGDPAERGTWSASSDSYDLGALDTTEGRQAIEGTDDGERRPPGETAEFERLRDIAG